MKRISPRSAMPAAIVCALTTGLALVLGMPLLALFGAAVAAGMLLVASRRAARAASPEDEARPVRPAVLSEADVDEQLLETLARDIARAERYNEPLTVCLVRAENYDGMTPVQRDATAFHLRATVERVTRASDSWFESAPGTFAIVLERCTGSEAAAFAERAALAANSRPVIAEGSRLAIEVTTAQLQYDPHQFVGARDFFAAVSAARFHAPGHRQRLVADGRFLREHIYGKDRSAGAA